MVIRNDIMPELASPRRGRGRRSWRHRRCGPSSSSRRCSSPPSSAETLKCSVCREAKLQNHWQLFIPEHVASLLLWRLLINRSREQVARALPLQQWQLLETVDKKAVNRLTGRSFFQNKNNKRSSNHLQNSLVVLLCCVVQELFHLNRNLIVFSNSFSYLAVSFGVWLWICFVFEELVHLGLYLLEFGWAFSCTRLLCIL